MKRRSMGMAGCFAVLVATLSVPGAALADGGADMYRLYNPNSGEHFYTASEGERSTLKSVGWRSEGTGWEAPVSGKPVYRVYNPNGGDHHYTTSAGERDMLVEEGWKDEGVGWSSGGSIAVYRLYNPSASTGAHHYTTSSGERDMLVDEGWKDEGVGWYATAEGKAEPSTPIGPAYVIDQGSFVVGGLRFDIPSYWRGKVRLATDGDGVAMYEIRSGIELAMVWRDAQTYDQRDYSETDAEPKTLRYPLSDGTYAICGRIAQGTADVARNSLCDYSLSDGTYVRSCANGAFYPLMILGYDNPDAQEAARFFTDLYSYGTGSYDDWFDEIRRFKPFVDMWVSAKRV